MTDFIATQKTYKGKTAGQWIKRAETAAMRAGNVEIITPDLPGCLLLVTARNTLVIENVDGHVVSLECGPVALVKLQTLTAAAEKAMLSA